MEKTIYKILRPVEWETLQTTGRFTGSSDDLRDGFVHFSAKSQVEKTLNKHFDGENHLILAEVPVSTLNTEALKWEVSTGGALYPHLYSEMTIDTVVKTWELNRGNDGQFAFPELEETMPLFKGGE